MMDSKLHPDVHLGHVHLRVADLDQATAFYRDVLGFEVTAYGPDFGLPGAAFLSAGGYHHHIGLNTWTSAGGVPPEEGHTGLYHLAVVHPDREELGRTVRRVLEQDHPIDGAEDHGATVSVYLSDPDGNGLELYYDRPREDWFDQQGNPILKAEPFDPRDLLADERTGDGQNARYRQKGTENVRRKRVSDSPAPGREGAPGRPGAEGSPEGRATPGRESAFVEEQVLPLTNRNE